MTLAHVELVSMVTSSVMSPRTGGIGYECLMVRYDVLMSIEMTLADIHSIYRRRAPHIGN